MGIVNRTLSFGAYRTRFHPTAAALRKTVLAQFDRELARTQAGDEVIGLFGLSPIEMAALLYASKRAVLPIPGAAPSPAGTPTPQ